MVTVIKKVIAERLESLGKKPKKGFTAHQFCGMLPLEEDALVIQRRLRDEWE